MKQRTLQNQLSIKGVGLHTGRKCHAVFLPAPENTGIHFVRTDLPGRPQFEATVENVVDVVRGTTLGRGDSRVYTVEHILSALNGLEIDNAIIELDENEPPVADGSSQSFVAGLRSIGVGEQSAEKKFFTVDSPLTYNSNQTIIRIEPAPAFEIICEIDYDHPMIKGQKFIFNRTLDYEKEISPARTFCFDYEIEALKRGGLAKGGSLDNAIVIGPTGIYNPGTALRFSDEFVRHKILDLMGDLMLLGSPLQARIVASRCGHGHNIKFLKQLIQERVKNRPLPVS